METIWNGIVKLINSGVDKLMLVLPISPFQKYLSAMDSIPWLGYLNYFIPIGTFISIFTAWLICMALYYFYSIIMRWIKIVGE